MKRLILYVWAIILAFGFAGCTWIGTIMERPRINIANVTPTEIKLFEQLFDLELRIQNPNDSPLVLNGLSFELEINDKPFASGLSDQNVTIGRFSSGIIHVQAITSLWSFVRQLAELQKTGMPRVTYRIKGALYAGPSSTKLRFDDAGEIQILVDPKK
jgi:LEA14-like dessication related protein